MKNNEHKNMNDSALEAQRYMFGLMTPDEEVAFEHGLARSSEMTSEFENANQSLTALYEKLAKGTPVPRKQLKTKVLEKAAASGIDLEQYAVEEFHLKAGDSEWVQTYIPGIELKMIYVDEDGRALMKARFAPGAMFPPHQRIGTEECLVLSGDFWADNQHLHAGDFVAGRAGEEPLPLSSEGGCELLLKIPIPHQILPQMEKK
jgi:anti-sigma factor ChrR (cupin superfamily)